MYLKSDSKKGWKRYHFILRASGLYYWPKEKARTARDLVCLATFDVNQIYYGIGWKKKYKAPTDFCFAVKHPRLQQPKSTKYIKFLCAEDNASLERWMVGIRVAKYGRQLMENYRTLVDELAQEDLDMLAHARSCSVSSIAPPTQNQTQYNTTNDNARQFTENSRHNAEVANARQYEGQRQSYNSEQRQSYNNDGRLSRASSSSSSGCLSDGAPSSCEVKQTPSSFTRTLTISIPYLFVSLSRGIGSFRMWRVSNGHDKEETLDESEIAPNVDHETIEGGGRDGSRRARFVSQSDQLGLRHVDKKAQSKKERHRLGRVRNIEETS